MRLTKNFPTLPLDSIQPSAFAVGIRRKLLKIDPRSRSSRDAEASSAASDSACLSAAVRALAACSSASAERSLEVRRSRPPSFRHISYGILVMAY